MKEMELKKLKRADLLEILVEQGERIESLERQLEEAKAELEYRYLTIEKAGSIAEASLKLNGVFEAAEAAARQYVDSIEHLNQKQEIALAEREALSKEKAAQMLANAENESAQMIDSAKRESERYWSLAQEKIYKLIEAHSDVLSLNIEESRNDASARKDESSQSSIIEE